MSVLAAVGSWLYVNTAGNLVASAITGTAVWLWGRRHVKRLHARLDRLHEHVAAIREAGEADGR